MRDSGVTLRIGLCLGRLLARLLRHRTLVDPDQRFPIGAIEDINPTGLPGLCYSFTRPSVDHGVKEHDWARCVVVPDVVMYLLEMPDIGAGLGLQRNDRGTEQIVAFPHRPVIIGSAIPGREIDQPKLRVERRRVPDRGSAGYCCAAWGRPGIAAEFVRTGYCKSPP